jgi:NAD(P)-dependent dehydrogenase (short-subunit alcohol dehydrogenase family)
MRNINKVVLITGASGGIGEAAATAFGKAGAKVAIAARRKERLEKIAGKIPGCLVIPVDISDELQARAMIDKTIEHFGRIDVLINNAARIIVCRSDELRSEDLISAFKTNLIGPVEATNHAVRYMKQHGGGHIINVGSPGFMIGIPLYGPYVCSKAAMSAWTRTLQAEWADSNINISEYFPGYIKTDSKPVSMYKGVDQDIIIDPDQSWLNKLFTKPKKPEDVARHLVKIVHKPMTIKYSGRSVRLGSFISLFSSFRIAIAKGMARNIRKRLGLSVFSET